MNINFNEFIANENVKAALTAAFVKERLPQAIILQGDEGVGKKTLAKLIANTVVCTNENKPCKTCPACQRAKAGSHPDIRIYEGSGKSGNISVETIRSIIDDAQKKPEETDRNIYLLFIKNKLSEASQNKLLKIMEEPPGQALFIITVNSVESLLPTIRSRTVCYTLLNPSLEKSAEYVSGKLEISFEEALKLAQLHNGNIGSMLGGKEQSRDILDLILEIFDGNDEDAFLAACYPLIKDRNLFKAVLEQFILVIRDSLLYASCSDEEFFKMGSNDKQAKRLSNRYRKAVLLKMLSLCSENIEFIKKNMNMNLLVTSFCAKLRETVLK